MTKQEKLDAFAWELALIVDADVREFTEYCIGILPSYFFTVAASSSGKYHPAYALGDGGLLRHTRAAVSIANTLLQTITFGERYTVGQKGAIISALILHDGAKHGIPKQKYTIKNHPNVICNHIEKKVTESMAATGIEPLNKCKRDAIYGLIRSHMGQWTDSDADKPLPTPETAAQKFVHLCDYLASRKQLEYNFDV
jgi:hypothetical protein